MRYYFVSEVYVQRNTHRKFIEPSGYRKSLASYELWRQNCILVYRRINRIRYCPSCTQSIEVLCQLRTGVKIASPLSEPLSRLFSSKRNPPF